MRLRNVWIHGMGFALAASVVACGGGGQSTTGAPATSAPAAAGALKVDSATAGELKGTVALDGAVPKNADIKMNADPVCVKQTAGSPQIQETWLLPMGHQ